MDWVVMINQLALKELLIAANNAKITDGDMLELNKRIELHEQANEPKPLDLNLVYKELKNEWARTGI